MFRPKLSCYPRLLFPWAKPVNLMPLALIALEVFRFLGKNPNPCFSGFRGNPALQVGIPARFERFVYDPPPGSQIRFKTIREGPMKEAMTFSEANFSPKSLKSGHIWQKNPPILLINGGLIFEQYRATSTQTFIGLIY